MEKNTPMKEIEFLIGYCKNVRNDDAEKYAISDLTYLIRRLNILKKRFKQIENDVDCMNPKYCGCKRCPSCDIFYNKLKEKTNTNSS
tara:strand:- start:9609 stop:9869 length:261 start_codon:yes stop_codon:yes gene_type:complete